MELNYAKIKMLENTMKSQRQMAIRIGMSNTGYAKMMQNKSCTVETLVTISKEFGKPIMYFFDHEENEMVLKEPDLEFYSCPDCRRRVKKIKEQNEEIAKLNKELNDLFRKYTKCYEELYGKKRDSSANSA